MLNLHTKKIIHPKLDGILKMKFFHQPLLIVFGLGVLLNLVFIKPQPTLSQIQPSSIGTETILEVPSSDNGSKLTFTLYHRNNVHYFSAGVGVEERNATYPAYPLKLIFVQGERAFLAGVTISITKSDGAPLVDIPSEHVMGPWLFVELPSGTYTIRATDTHHRIITKNVQVGGKVAKVVHFRWPA